MTCTLSRSLKYPKPLALVDVCHAPSGNSKRKTVEHTAFNEIVLLLLMPIIMASIVVIEVC